MLFCARIDQICKELSELANKFEKYERTVESSAGSSQRSCRIRSAPSTRSCNYSLFLCPLRFLDFTCTFYPLTLLIFNPLPMQVKIKFLQYLGLSAAAHWPFATLTTAKAMATRRRMNRVISENIK